MMAGYAVTKNEWVLKALDRFKVDVINVTGRELAFVNSSASRTSSGDSRFGPLLSRMVSANTVTGSSDNASIRPYIVVPVADRKAPAGRPIRVAFVGISDDKNQPGAGLKAEGPVETARRIAPRAKRESDLVVVLAHTSSEVASRIAQEAQGVDAVIAGNGKEFTMPLTEGHVPIVFTPYETRMLGELRFYRDPGGRYVTKNRFIGLDNTVPDDQPASAFVVDSRQAVKKEVEKFTKPMEAGSPAGTGQGPAGALQSNFVSAQACLACHRAEYMTWSNTAHARAINSLATRAAELDTGCLVCHTTGFNKGGFQNIADSRTLVNVQCEECHGPGRAHIASPDKTYGRIADIQAICSRCHTAETSAEFKLDSFWAKIRH